MLHAIIMAGGSGTRFWPASRELRPKQLLKLAGEESMIQATVNRLGGLVGPNQLLIVTNRRLIEPISSQLPAVPRRAIIGEPCKRDTAPCIGLAAALVSAQDPDATMVVMPADHVISTDESFREALQHAVDLVEAEANRIVTFGITPTYPAEIYGYIERSENDDPVGTDPATYRVVRFREKPDAETAAKFLEAGNFYWNSGIFVWKARTVWEALAKFEPVMFSHLSEIAAAIGTPEFETVLEKEFAAIVGKSIDYAVMENFEGEILVVEAPFRWDDVGNWPALARLHQADSAGNTIIGKHLGIDTKRSIIRTDDEHLVVTLGLEDVIVVHTPDATLVASRDQEESIRKIVDELKKSGWSEHL